MSDPDEQQPSADADEAATPPLGAPTDVAADPQDLEPDATTPTSTAEEYREDGEAMGGTGGLDAGGAG